MSEASARTAMAAQVEDATCPLCGSDERRQRYSFPPFAVVRCAACRFHYLSPRLTRAAMEEIYRAGDYFEGGTVGYDSYARQEQALRATFRAVARRLASHGFAGGDLLEIGAGYGLLLDEAAGYFASATGTELSGAAAIEARRRGRNVITGGIDELPAGARFDCVLAGHVIEHVYEPRSFVGQLAGLLRPGGALILGTPFMGSFWQRLMGSRWPSFKIPEHVLYFDRRSLSGLLAEAGLSDVKPFPYPHAFPLALVLAKLGVGAIGQRLGRLGELPIWLPATTLAYSARRARDG